MILYESVFKSIDKFSFQYYHYIMKKLNWLRLKRYIYNQNLNIFTTKDVINAFGTQKRTTDSFLFNYVKKGEIIRLKAGLFTLLDNLPHEFILANRMIIPSYISLDSALSFHKIIPESVYGITSVTTKATKEFVVNNLSFTFNKIKKEAFSGYELYDTGSGTAYIATPEKAMADFLYFVYLGKRIYNDRINLKEINIKKLKNYLKLFGKNNLIKYVR